MDRDALTDRLYAERLAAPLRGPACFFEAGFTESDTITDAQVRARAEVMREDLAGNEADVEWAIEEVDKTWVKGEPTNSPRRIVSVLSRQARGLLRHSGRHMVLQVRRSEPGREILRWRFVSLALPPGILIAAATRGDLVPPAAVRLLDRSIGPDYFVAHNHVHHAAMMSFADLWTLLRVRALLRPGELAAGVGALNAFCPELHRGICPWGRGEMRKRRLTKRPLRPRHVAARAQHMAEWRDLIRQAFIARGVLDRHSHHASPLADCDEGDCMRVVQTILRPFLSGRTKLYRETGTPYPWPDELIHLARRFGEANAPAILPSSHRRRRMNFVQEQTAEERSLLQRAFQHLRPVEADPWDVLYERLFVQYLRIKTAVFGLLVHPPGEPGLAQFQEHFQQIKVYAPEADLLRPSVPCEPGLEVRATEYRVAPDAWFKILRRNDAEIEQGDARQGTRPEAAWLIHFKRDKHDEGLPLYGSSVRKMEGEADQIARALAAKPTLLRRLRGIDICGVEEDQPLWVSAETLRRLRAFSGGIAGRRPELCLEPLRLTIHAGEDFRWLTSGMRAIAEPFHWRLIERGDRIGHGLAITLDPREWWRSRKGRVILVKRFDRLLDLAFLAEYTKERSAEQEQWLREESDARSQLCDSSPSSRPLTPWRSMLLRRPRMSGGLSAAAPHGD